MLYPMKELDVHNDLLGDVRKMDEVFDELGYLFFRDVLDHDAIDEARDSYLSVLADDYGLVNAGQKAPIWNGNDSSEFPFRVPEMYASKTYERFVGNPKIHAFFEGVAGEPISWIPATEYRLTPPKADSPEDPVAGRHQDGFFNLGYRFRVCWMPMSEIDEATGGLAICPGLNKRGFLHDRDNPPKFPIPAGAIKDSEWARPKVYHPGDVVIFSDVTPHSGLPNSGKQFRLSMDARYSKLTEPQPVYGPLTAVTPDSVTIETSVGPVTLKVDEDTFLRLKDGARQPLSTLPTLYELGDTLLAGREGDHAILIRPQRGPQKDN